ncbi:hypothetical protein FB451DRAFT_1558187 [Mycena latifolia]|nr:hypothetical protein FB451DRAFT_1558187 [Mycena latifolia]
MNEMVERPADVFTKAEGLADEEKSAHVSTPRDINRILGPTIVPHEDPETHACIAWGCGDKRTEAWILFDTLLPPPRASPLTVPRPEAPPPLAPALRVRDAARAVRGGMHMYSAPPGYPPPPPHAHYAHGPPPGVDERGDDGRHPVLGAPPHAHGTHGGCRIGAGGGIGMVVHTDDAATKLSDRVRRRCFNCCTAETSTWRRSNLSPVMSGHGWQFSAPPQQGQPRAHPEAHASASHAAQPRRSTKRERKRECECEPHGDGRRCSASPRGRGEDRRDARRGERRGEMGRSRTRNSPLAYADAPLCPSGSPVSSVPPMLHLRIFLSPPFAFVLVRYPPLCPLVYSYLLRVLIPDDASHFLHLCLLVSAYPSPPPTHLFRLLVPDSPYSYSSSHPHALPSF